MLSGDISCTCISFASSEHFINIVIYAQYVSEIEKQGFVQLGDEAEFKGYSKSVYSKCMLSIKSLHLSQGLCFCSQVAGI